ncbi:hypothetical protein C8J57DRAFT_1719156 [Mycena rebaudengoi]|nr:hypothetical protein C8J57DRAFT_1719156 [Mycena rebaudengoi]
MPAYYAQKQLPSALHLFLSLRAACDAVHERLDTWLLDSINSAGELITFLDPKLKATKVLCTVSVNFSKGLDDSPFYRSPDIYMLWLHVDVPGLTGIQPSHLRSPMVILGYFQGCNEDGNAPPWTRRLKPGERYRFPASRAFSARLFCGLLDLRVGCALDQTISSHMLSWAYAVSIGTEAEQSVQKQCQKLRAARHQVSPAYILSSIPEGLGGTKGRKGGMAQGGGGRARRWRVV